MHDRVRQLRDQLTAKGLDAGADTIHRHLRHEGITIDGTMFWRILGAGGRITAQPHK